MLRNFTLCFIPLFVAIDPPLAVPFFASLTSEATPERRRRVAREAVLAAFAVGALFLAAGKALFSAIGITENDFRVGGGLVLLVSSIGQFALSQKKSDPVEGAELVSGASPLGVPLIMGPAAITTLVVLAKSYGAGMVLTAAAVNLAIVWCALRYSELVTRVVDARHMNVISKIAALMLVSIAVMMIRVGLRNELGQ
jgi:multiple antibiotic resistance protein